MPSHPKSYMHGWRPHSQVQDWMWWLMPYMLMRDCPRVWWYRTLTLRCAMAVRMWPSWWEIVWHTLRLWRSDLGGESGACQLGAWATDMAWNDRCIGWGPRHPHTEAYSKTKAGKALWEVWLEWLGILVTIVEESAHLLLAAYHDIFSFEPNEFHCTQLTKHVIRVTDDASFKEWFRWIPLPSVEEVHAHLWEMLDSGVICPSQSSWCNAVVLVQKKDRSLHFCINFCHLNVHIKKDSYPLPRIQETFDSLVSAGHFFHAWPWSLDSGRSRWTSCQSSTPCLLLPIWASLNVTTHLLGCATCQPQSRG